METTKRYPRIPVEQEQEVYLKAKAAGDQDAILALIMGHYGLIRHLAIRYTNYAGMPVEELEHVMLSYCYKNIHNWERRFDEKDFSLYFFIFSWASRAAGVEFQYRNAQKRSAYEVDVVDHSEEISTTDERVDVSAIYTLIDELGPRDKKIIKMRFGLPDEPGGEATLNHDLEEIGKKLGICRERVRQLLFRAMERLRKRVEERGLTEMDF